MKTYHLIENLDDTYGGPAKSVPYLAKSLEELEVQNTLLSIKYHDRESNEVIKESGLNWLSFSYDYVKKTRYSKALTTFLINAIYKDKNVLLHTHNLWNYIPYVAYSFGKKYKLPYILAIRGSLYPWSLAQSSLQKKIAWKLFQKKALNNASCIHVTDKAELEAVRNLGITSPIALVPNGINLDEFKNMNIQDKAKQNLGLEKDKNYILFLSRVHPKKGLEYLVRSWVDLANKYPKWDLLIVGPIYDEKYHKKLENEIAKNHLQDRVHFTGMIGGEKRIDCFSASSLFALPSHTENFGIAIAEAMAAKLPVITTHGTPWQEIEEYDAGWWVELSQKNIDNALAEALSSSEYELKQKGLNGFNLIQKYEWKYQAKKMKEVYEWVLGSGDKPRFVYEVGDNKRLESK